MEYAVEHFFVGLPDYYLYQEHNLLEPKFSFGTHQNNTIEDYSNLKEEDFNKEFLKIYDEYDIKIAYRILKKLIHLEPGEEKNFITKVNFPNYKGRYFNMENNKIYFFQIGLNNPKKYLPEK